MSATRKADARDDRQHLGNQAHSRTQGKEQSLRPVAQHKAADHNDKRQHDKHAPYQSCADTPGAGAKLRTRPSAPRRCGRLLGNAHENGCRRCSIHDGRSRANSLPFPLDGLAALARKRRFGDKDVVALCQDHIDWAEHSGIQANRIAGYELAGIDLNPARVDALPNGCMVRLKHVAVEAAFGLVFVEQAHQTADQPHQKQHCRRKDACLTLRLRHNIDQKSQACQRNQQRRERVKE